MDDVTKTFIRGALQGFIFGPISTILVWVIMSALLSMVILFVSILLNWDGASHLTLNQIVNWDTSTLTALPYFSFLNYIQVLWAGLLVPVVIAGGLYVIVLAQGEQNERIVDFFEVARTNIILMGLGLIFWILGGTYWAFTHDSAVLQNLQIWQDFMANATQGLAALGMDQQMSTLEIIMTDIYPYVPFPFLAVVYIYLFANIHAGWIGNA